MDAQALRIVELEDRGADWENAKITALRAELDALKAQEPVAWALTSELEKRETTTRAHLWFSDPVNCMWTKLYAVPVAPAKPAQQLTDEQISALADKVFLAPSGVHDFARAIEAAHGIKGQA
jgi:hypothetical protein